MAYKWPALDYERVANIRSLAEKCVETLNGKSLFEQFMQQQIVEITLRPLFTLGGMAYEAKKNGLVVYLLHKKEDWPASDAKCITLAHDLGHSFGWEMNGVGLVAKQVWRPREGAPKDIESLEEFADTFAYLWLSYPKNRKSLTKFLEKYKAEKDEEQLTIDVRALWPS